MDPILVHNQIESLILKPLELYIQAQDPHQLKNKKATSLRVSILASFWTKSLVCVKML
jgi:hypothetical protein